MNDLIVHAWLDGALVPAGKLRWNASGKVSFWYGRHFRESGYALDPVALPLTSERFTADGLYGPLGVFGDTQPDQWGRYVLDQLLVGPLTDSDYLVADDSTWRMGALHFSESLNTPAPVSPSFRTPVALQTMIERIDAHKDTRNDTGLPFLKEGSSAGGARPKSIVDRDGVLWITKYPSREDHVNHARVEWATHRLAEMAGINTPEFQIEPLQRGQEALLVKRFDRQGTQRLHYLSGHTLCRVTPTGGERSYLRLADELARYSGQPTDDREQLFRRMVFNILISNRDDHAKNHALIRPGTQVGEWRLSPAFDVVAGEGRSRHQCLVVGESGARSTLANALSGAHRFALKPDKAKDLVDALIRTVAQWETVFEETGVTDRDRNNIRWAFLSPDVFRDSPFSAPTSFRQKR